MRNRSTLRTCASGVVLALALAMTTTVMAAGTDPAERGAGGSPGASGVGDPYYPLDGNGGYDVSRYNLNLHSDPATDLLTGRATIRARATKHLSAFNLDLVGLTVRKVKVDGRRASWSRDGQELTVEPRRSLPKRKKFTVRVLYDGVPAPVDDVLGISGFLATDDGFDIAGEPHVAATWFPVNDHPTDKASYRFRVTVPRGPEVVANGDLVSKRTKRGWTTWTWKAVDPMASYLTTVNLGDFDFTTYRRDGVRYLDAIDPDLFDPLAEPSTGAGDPDPLHLRSRLLHRPLLRRRRGRARAGAPVVRRQRVPQALARHLAQRGVRDVRRVAVVRAGGSQHLAGDLRLLRLLPRRRPAVAADDR